MKKSLIVVLCVFILFLVYVYVSESLFWVIGIVIGLTLYFLIYLGLRKLGNKIAKHYHIVIVKAPDDELRREDDILLQSVTFSAAIVFFYANFLVENQASRISLSIAIIILAIAFYLVRAWAKLKESPTYRFWSMMLLAVLLGSYIATFFSNFVQHSFGLGGTDPIYAIISTMVLAIPLYLITLFRSVFSKRYGYK